MMFMTPSARVLVPGIFLFSILLMGNAPAAETSPLKKLEKVEGLTVPAAQIAKLPERAVHNNSELVMSIKVDYKASPQAKGENSPVHITASIYPSKGGNIFTDGEGELFLIDKDSKIVVKEKAPLVKLCPT